MWATLGEYPVDIQLSMATEADTYGVPRKRMTTPGSRGWGCGTSSFSNCSSDPVLGSGYRLQKEHIVYTPETIASLSRQYQLPCPEMTLE